jgi:outer membrane protein W
MKKLLLKVFAVLFLASAAISNSQAQSTNKVWSFGPEIGINIAKYGMDSDETDFNSGLALGGFLTYSIENTFAVTGKILYSQKGAKYQVGGTEVKQHLNYVEIPVLARAFFNKEGMVRPNIFVGPSFGFLTGAKAKVGSSDYEDITDGSSNENYKDVFNSFDFGIAGGLGFNIRVASEMYFIVDARYTHGLSDISVANDSSNNQAFALTAALSFGL